MNKKYLINFCKKHLEDIVDFLKEQDYNLDDVFDYRFPDRTMTENAKSILEDSDYEELANCIIDYLIVQALSNFSYDSGLDLDRQELFGDLGE